MGDGLVKLVAALGETIVVVEEMGWRKYRYAVEEEVVRVIVPSGRSIPDRK